MEASYQVGFNPRTQKNPLTEFVPEDLKTEVGKAKAIFRQLVQDSVVATLAPVMLADLLLNEDEEQNTRHAAEVRTQLLREFTEPKMSYVAKKLAALSDYFSQHSSSLTPQDIETLTSEEFVAELPLLPGFEKALEKFPNIMEACKTKAKVDAKQMESAIRLLSDQELNKAMEENQIFIDQITNEVVRHPVHLLPFDNSDAVSLETVNSLLKNNEKPRHPFLGVELAGVEPALDTELDMLVFYHQFLEWVIEETSQERLSFQIDSSSPDQLQFTIAGLNLIKSRVRLDGRQFLKRYLERLTTQYSFDILFEKIYLEKKFKDRLIQENDPEVAQIKKIFIENRHQIGINFLNTYHLFIDTTLVDLFKKWMVIPENGVLPLGQLKWKSLTNLDQ